MNNKPTVQEMLKEAAENFDGRVKNSDLRDYIQKKHGDVKTSTINAHITMCTVNNPSRIHWYRNKKPRVANENIDFLFNVDKGVVELYDPKKHGTWEIRKDENEKLTIGQLDMETLVEEGESEIEDEETLAFPLESHLRDFIAENISTIQVDNRKLSLFVDENERDGVEYPTGEVGLIDILAIDDDKNFVVFELKLSKGSDKALGQIQRYMGWVKANLAENCEVKGVIICKNMNKKIKYAALVAPDISLFEYDLIFKIRPVS